MGGGGAAASPAGPCGCMVALLRKSQGQVEARLADRTRLEAFVKIQHEFWVARVGLLQAQLQQMRKAEASRRRCEAVNLEILLGDKERELGCCHKLAVMLKSNCRLNSWPDAFEEVVDEVRDRWIENCEQWRIQGGCRVCTGTPKNSKNQQGSLQQFSASVDSGPYLMLQPSS